MSLEAATFLNDLVPTNPPGGDQLKQADDHMRLIKAVLQASFPSISFARYLERPRVDVVDAATPAVWAATSNYINLLGTTTTTGFASGTDGQHKLVRFAGVRVLTQDPSLLELPGSVNITTAVGDHALIQCLGGTANKVIAYFRLNGKAVVETDQIPAVVATDVGKSLVLTDDLPKTIGFAFSPPIGSVVAWPTASPPSGWRECDGSSLLRASFPNLFIVLGVTYGAADGTHFNIPDYRGEFLRGMDPGATRDPDSASRTDRGDATTGANVGTKQGHQFASHTHDFPGAILSSSPTGSGATRVESQSTLTTVAAGGNETRPRNVNVKWIIKTD